MEHCIPLKLLYEKRNELIREGRYTYAIDELILKIIDATNSSTCPERGSSGSYFCNLQSLHHI